MANVSLPSTECRAQSDELESPTWLELNGELCEALLNTPEGLLKLLAATERAVFERLLELSGTQDASQERQRLGQAIEVILTLKDLKAWQSAGNPSATHRTGSPARRTTLVLHHNAKMVYQRLA